MDKQMIDQAMITAVRHHHAGRLREAETIYRQVLASAPKSNGWREAWLVGKKEPAKQGKCVEQTQTLADQ